MTSSAIDPVALSQDLIRCPSVTPEEGGALDLLETTLTELGFTCHRLPFSDAGTPDVDNLYARIGTGGPNFCFAGHTDVVPPGDTADWTTPPFAADIRDAALYGRGAADMKCAIACFVAGAAAFLKARGDDFGGAVSLLITGDEEGPAVNGTRKMLGWLDQNGEKLDACLVGEPTNPKALGDMVKIGRRGSYNATLTVEGIQGHVAYPALADNPVPKLLKLLTALTDAPLDHGNDHFQPSNLEITSIDVGNPATNVIPARAEARFNVRFNDGYSTASLEAELTRRLDTVGIAYTLTGRSSGDSFLTPPGRLSDVVSGAISAVTGSTPELSTSGGTSDARFIKDHCPVVEFGLINQTAHKVDEFSTLADIRALADIYRAVLDAYFAEAAA